ncbi:hypothetical protein N0V82_010844 [Gnomoniopsis sp. IMI 355080]|nr:hypothetical protein N0V82_010844 [Gnomoniopsis sp. IMI 355080]
MAVLSRRGLSELVPIFLLVLVLLSDAVRSEQDGTQKPMSITSENARRYPDLPVLGYVTPWHSRGKQLVEDNRHKFDIVSPVWYTVHAKGDGYEVQGGPPAEEDDEWYKRLQQAATSANGVELKPLQVVPRFMLDGWNEDDYRQFVFNTTRWEALSDAVLEVVKEKNFDGVVFESGATHLLPQSLVKLSEALHGNDKLLIVVMQPIRPVGSDFDALAGNQAAMIDATNNLILRALPQLSLVADYFSIMTYDMSGPGGRAVSQKDIQNEKMSEAAATHDIREPGPNTNAAWVRENLITFVEATDPATANQLQFQASLEALQASRKFLMGVPLYGYKYPVVFADKVTGKFIKPTPTIPLHEHAMMTGAAALKNRPKIPENAKPIMRDAGEPMTATQIADVLKEHQPEIFKLESEGEYYFDYQPERNDIWTRVFLPTVEGITHVMNTIKDVVDDDLVYNFGGAGVALWEVGQSTEELLASL